MSSRDEDEDHDMNAIINKSNINDTNKNNDEHANMIISICFWSWRHFCETSKQKSLLEILLENKRNELLAFAISEKAKKMRKLVFKAWKWRTEESKIATRRLSSKLERMRFKILQKSFEIWYVHNRENKRASQRLGILIERRALKMKRESFERWRAYILNIKRESKLTNELMELKNEFEIKHRDQLENELVREEIQKKEIEDLKRQNEHEKLLVASERASVDAEKKQMYEAEIALLKLKEEQEKKKFDERKYMFTNAIVAAKERHIYEMLIRKFYVIWREHTIDSRRAKQTLRYFLLKNSRKTIGKTFDAWKNEMFASRKEKMRDVALEKRLANFIGTKEFRTKRRILEDVFSRERILAKRRERKADQFRKMKLQKKAFTSLKSCLKRSKTVKNLQMRAFSRLASRKLAKAFQIWKMYANTKRYENPAKAIVHYDSHLAPKILKRTFLAWRKVKDDKKRLRRIETDSINKRDLKALKDTITFWHKKTVARRLALGQERKLDRAILFRERSKMRYAFRAWRTLAFAEKLRDETLVRTLKTKGDYERHFVQPFMRWKLISEQRRLITEKIEQRNRIDLLRVAFVSWKRSTKDAHIRLVLTEKFIAQKNRKKQMQVQRDILLAWNTFVGTLKQTRIEQMKRAVVERAIADESVTHFGTPEGIAIVQAAKRFHRRNFLERVLSVVFQKWREESARRNTILLALQSAFVEENDARRLRVAFRMWRERAVEMRSARESILIASKSPLKKKDNSMRISREGRGNYQERSSTSSASWDFDIDFEANTRNLKSLNDKATLIKKVQGQMTMFVDNTNNASNNRFSALDRSYRDTIEACIALEAKLELKQGIISTPPARKMTNTVPTTRASREHMQNALKERLMDIETSAMVLLESARATRVRRENEKASLVLK
jgi:hypothetical protein